MEEVVPGECRLGGAALMDDDFLDLLRRKLREMYPQSAFPVPGVTELSVKTLMDQAWNTDLKFRFSSNQAGPWNYQLPTSWPNPVSGGRTISFSQYVWTPISFLDDNFLAPCSALMAITQPQRGNLGDF